MLDVVHYTAIRWGAIVLPLGIGRAAVTVEWGRLSHLFDTAHPEARHGAFDE